MIPIGTRCIVVGSLSGEGRHIGRECVVVWYPSPGWRSRLGNLYDCAVEIDGIEWALLFRHLIPIGHDPDTETRTTDREVTA